MRYQDGGAFHSVTLTAREVEAFKARWPCSGLPDRAIRFEFAKSNGDLVDVHPSNVDGDALVALMEDARRYARRQLPRPCGTCGGEVDPKLGPITLVPWRCAACTAPRLKS